MLQEYRSVTVTLNATDQGKGRVIIGASEKPRLILGLSCYSGTNTAASMMGLFVLSSQPAASGTEFDLSTQIGIKAIQGTLPMNNSTGLGTAQTFIPTVDTRAGGTWLLMPPYSLLIGAPAEADLDGTVIFTISSAELC